MTSEDKKKFEITREDEARGYQAIVQRAIPRLVQDVITGYNQFSPGDFDVIKTTESLLAKEIIKYLRKITREWDTVEWFSRMPRSGRIFEFKISKRQDTDNTGRPLLSFAYYHNDPNPSASGWIWMLIAEPEEEEDIETPEFPIDENVNSSGPTIDDFRVSKKEEAEALAFIKQWAVGDVVDYYEANKVVYGRQTSDTINVEQVALQLRKIAHFKAGEPGNPNDEADYIIYEGYDPTQKIWPPTRFEFIITKDYDEYGWIHLDVGYKNPLKRGHSILTSVRKIKRYPPTPLKEVKFRRKQQVLRPLLSKREKDEAFYHLKLLIVPKAVNEANEHLIWEKGKNTPLLTVQDVLKNLKKKSDEGDRVLYLSTVPGIASITFFIEKKNTKFVIDRYSKPMVYNGYISAASEYPITFLVHPERPLNESSLTWLKTADLPPGPVTKKEEMMMVNLLKQHYVKEFPDIGKYLKKTRIHPSPAPEITSDKIQYEYDDGKKRILFALCRTGSGLWILMWEWGNNSARDHLHVNVLSKTIKEAFEKPQRATIDKKEELLGFAFIKKGLVPKAVEIANEFCGTNKPGGWCRFQPVTIEEVLKSLKKTKHEKNRDYTEYIEYAYNQSDRIPMRFWIKKAKNPWEEYGEDMVLMAGFEKPMTIICYNYVVIFDDTGKPFIREGQTPIEGSQYLNKREIHEAMDFIKKVMIPEVVKEYDKHKIRQDDKITKEELTRNLKISTMKDAAYGSTIFLHSIIKGRHFKFMIAKRKHWDTVNIPKNKILKSHWRLAASYMLPMGVGDKPSSTWFWIGYPEKPGVEAKDTGLIFEANNPTLTRKEELYAVDVIKKTLLADDLENFNQNMSNIRNWHKAKYPTEPTLEPLTLEQAQKLLHKTFQGEEGNIEFAMYVVHGPNEFPSMHYFINKNSNGTISIYYEELIERRFRETIITP